MAFKKEVKQIFNAIGANEWLMRGRKTEMLVLCYHGVVAEQRADRWSYENWVDTKSFRDQLRWLKEVVEITDFAGFQRWHEGSWKGSKGPALITFDDGYRNNITEAAPVLVKESVPATFFLTTGYIGSPHLLWVDEVRVRILNWPETTVRMPSGGRRQISASADKRRGLAREVVEAAKRVPENKRKAYCEYLRSKTETLELMDDPEARSFMNWDEARKLSQMGFEIGAHTVTHPILSNVSPEQLLDELRESKAAIERELNAPVKSIAYPNGSPSDVNAQVLGETEKAGFELGFTTIPEWQKAGGNRYQIGRVCVAGHTDLSTFKCYASGLHKRIMGVA